ncbi:MAG TPA: nucleotidyltransferase substrate binding protein [Chroococcales cyanobacterium]
MANFRQAFSQLASACELSQERPLSDLEKQGLIQAFEFTHELAWCVMKDYFEYQGNSSITGSRDATRQAFSVGLISDGEGWMEMIKSRNQTSHTYNRGTANEIAEKITSQYCRLFRAFLEKMTSLAKAI